MIQPRFDMRELTERTTHRWAVVMTDAFMSGWGGAQGGASFAAWACRGPNEAATVERWVRGRGEARRVRTVFLPTWKPKRRGVAHVHIYVVNDGHAALGGAK